MTTGENWIPANWDAPEGVVAGTTLRYGGVSTGSFSTLNLGAYADDDGQFFDVKSRRLRRR
jgi:copper oxidase (laccase) domain-containing protein